MGIIKQAASYLSAADDLNAPIEDYVPAIPREGTIFLEGYLLKRSRHSHLSHWNRRYFALQCFPRKRGQVYGKAKLLYADAFNCRPRKVFSLTNATEAHLSTEYEKEGHDRVLKITRLECDKEGYALIPEIILYNEDLDELKEWKSSIELAVARVNDAEKQRAPLSTGRFYEGMLYKLTRATPHRWVERHFELEETLLSYKHSPTEHKRWSIDLIGATIEPNRCTKDSHPTPFVVRIRKGSTILDLCFRNETNYMSWLRAITQNLENSDTMRAR